jgi:hypothetical protein
MIVSEPRGTVKPPRSTRSAADFALYSCICDRYEDCTASRAAAEPSTCDLMVKSVFGLVYEILPEKFLDFSEARWVYDVLSISSEALIQLVRQAGL